MAFDLDLIKSSFDQYIVRPSAAFGLGGFVWDIEGDATVNHTAEITDHYTEENSAIQDHIAVRPKRVTLRNYVGELVYRQDGNTNTLLQSVVQKLTILDSYLPALSNAASQAKSVFEKGISKDAFNQLTSIKLQDAADLWGLTKNLTPPITRQQQAYMYFKALHEQKILISLETPFEYMTNMAIESIVSYQADDTKYISDFTITLKQMRFAKVRTVKFDESKFQSRSQAQISDVTSGGKLQGKTVALDPSKTPPPQLANALPSSKSLSSLPVINVAPVSQQAITNQDIINLGKNSGIDSLNAYYPKTSVPNP